MFPQRIEGGGPTWTLKGHCLFTRENLKQGKRTKQRKDEAVKQGGQTPKKEAARVKKFPCQNKTVATTGMQVLREEKSPLSYPFKGGKKRFFLGRRSNLAAKGCLT